MSKFLCNYCFTLGNDYLTIWFFFFWGGMGGFSVEREILDTDVQMEETTKVLQRKVQEVHK